MGRGVRRLDHAFPADPLAGTRSSRASCSAKSFSWIEKLCLYLFVWASHLGVAIAVKHKEQLRILTLMDLLEKRFPKVVKVCYIVSAFVRGLLHPRVLRQHRDARKHNPLQAGFRLA
ncbi:MAG: TRAP transporter small permease subunit [Bilophila sp.]